MVKTPRTVPAGRSLVADPKPWKWQDDAACAGLPLALFYGPPGEREPARSIREAKAKAVCEGCPLATQRKCLEVALVPGPKHQHGVQGGMTPEERIAERRNRTRRKDSYGRAA